MWQLSMAVVVVAVVVAVVDSFWYVFSINTKVKSRRRVLEIGIHFIAFIFHFHFDFYILCNCHTQCSSMQVDASRRANATPTVRPPADPSLFLLATHLLLSACWFWLCFEDNSDAQSVGGCNTIARSRLPGNIKSFSGGGVASCTPMVARLMPQLAAGQAVGVFDSCPKKKPKKKLTRQILNFKCFHCCCPSLTKNIWLHKLYSKKINKAHVPKNQQEE